MKHPDESEEKDTLPMESPQAGLEKMYIEEYLQGKGFAWKQIITLPEAEAKLLMIEACRYASNKLAEVESRAHLRHEIHGSTQV